jgi:hypothetical protein
MCSPAELNVAAAAIHSHTRLLRAPVLLGASAQSWVGVDFPLQSHVADVQCAVAVGMAVISTSSFLRSRSHHDAY